MNRRLLDGRDDWRFAVDLGELSDVMLRTEKDALEDAEQLIREKIILEQRLMCSGFNATRALYVGRAIVGGFCPG